MSMHLFAFTADQPSTFEEWQGALEDCGLPLRIHGNGDLKSYGDGFLPMSLRSVMSGAEVLIESTEQSFPLRVEKLAGRHRVVHLIWRSDVSEAYCAFLASAALAKVFDAKVLDNASGRYLTFEQLCLLGEGKELQKNELVDADRMAVVQYLPVKNESGQFEHCQRCKWIFPEPRSEMLCLECAARCPTCDSYDRGCKNPGVFQIMSDPEYWRWIMARHVKDNFNWFSDIKRYLPH